MAILNMRPILASLFILCSANAASAEDEINSVTEVIQNYLDGTEFAKPELIEKAFTQSLEVQWLGEDDQLLRRAGPDYVDMFRDGEYRARKGTIVMLDVTDRAATAKVEIAWNNRIYTDYMLLLKVEGHWKITNKIAVWTEQDSSEAE